MFKWRVQNSYSNVIRKNASKYHICFSHINELTNFEITYKFLENGYPVRYISTEGKDYLKDSSKKGILEEGIKILDNVSTCEECGEVKIVSMVNEVYKCYSCNYLDRIKLEHRDTKLQTNSILEILSFKDDTEADDILLNIPMADIFKDNKNDDFIYAKGVFKIPLLNEIGYGYFPAFFYIDGTTNELYEILFLKSNVLDILEKFGLDSKLDVYSSYYVLWNLTEINSTIEKNFSPYVFQLGEFRTLSFIPLKQNIIMWPNYIKI
jgi:hypothetical protein